MGVGKEFKKRNSQYMEFDEDGVIEGVFEGMKTIVKESFGQEKEVMRYKMDGKTFDSQSGSLAVQMDEITVGQKIRITRTGKSADTKYHVEVI